MKGWMRLPEDGGKETSQANPAQKPFPPSPRVASSNCSERGSVLQPKGRFGEIEHFHFIGIGGAGMSALAEVLLREGYRVSGSDAQDSSVLAHLRRLGATVYLGHAPSHLQGAEAVVYSSAIPDQNPELSEARRQDLPLVHRGELLAEVMRYQEGISIAGTHGKTTTTAMVGLVLQAAGLDPTVLVGARVGAFGMNARVGRGRHLVAESDESDRSFLLLRPVHVVATNIDRDHLDEYSDLDDLKQAFLQHLQSVPFYGTVFLCRDDPNLRSLRKKVHRRVLTYGLRSKADLCARILELSAFQARYLCVYRGRELGQIRLQVGGKHNVLNSLAAVAVGLRLEAPFDAIQEGLGEFQGAARRLERKGERKGILVVDDYGHHPAEIQATLQACKSTRRRIVLVFQPHRFTRTAHLMQEFATCFGQADRLYLMDIYSAGETAIPGVSSRRLARLIRRHRQVTYVADMDTLLERLEAETVPGDLLLTMGAGNVWKVGEAFLERN